MKINKIHNLLVILILLVVFPIAGFSAGKIPLVYSVENRGEKFAKPAMPDLSQLPVIEPLTDPFSWSNGKGRSTKFRDWSKRRNEIGAEIQHYEIGIKPSRPEDITAEYKNDMLENVTCCSPVVHDIFQIRTCGINRKYGKEGNQNDNRPKDFVAFQ